MLSQAGQNVFNKLIQKKALVDNLCLPNELITLERRNLRYLGAWLEEILG